MKRLLWLLLLAMLLSGCATANFEKRADGTVSVSYFRLFTTSMELSASLGDAKVESKGQKIDAAMLANILTAAGVGR